MTAHDLLERRAERGTARGAANVWADAQPTLRRSSQGHWAFRLAATWLIGILLAIALVPGDLTTSADVDDTGGSSEAEIEVESPLEHGIDPITIRDMALSEVYVLGGGDPSFAGNRVEIYAHPTDPFNNPIIAIEELSLNPFASGANVTAEQLEEINDKLLGDHDWRPSDVDGFVEVLRFNTEGLFSSDSWRFGHTSPDGRIVDVRAQRLAESELLQAMYPYFGAEGKTTVSEADIVGQRGLTVHQGDGTVAHVWASNGYIYEAYASRGGVTAPLQADEVEVVGAGAWNDAFGIAIETQSNIDGMAYWVAIVVILLGFALGSPLYFAVSRHWTALRICVVFALPSIVYPAGLFILVPIGVAIAWMTVRPPAV